MISQDQQINRSTSEIENFMEKDRQRILTNEILAHQTARLNPSCIYSDLTDFMIITLFSLHLPKALLVLPLNLEYIFPFNSVLLYHQWYLKNVFIYSEMCIVLRYEMKWTFLILASCMIKYAQIIQCLKINPWILKLVEADFS